MEKEVFPIRLQTIRKMRGLSLRKLSDLMDGVVSANTLDKYERGKTFPSSKVVIKLSSALGVCMDEFFKPITVQIRPDDIKYRKRSSLSKKEMAKIDYYASSFLEKYIEVEEMCGEKKMFSTSYHDVDIKAENDVLSIAARFRNDFHLGNAPISNPIEMLECAGVKIIEVDASAKFDGDNFTCNGIFVIVLNRAFTQERKRMSLFHEVAHKIMKFPKGVDEERYCNIFANEVLLPSEVFIQRIGKVRKDISLVELRNLQYQYGISIDAMMVKARQLGIISQSRYVSFYKHKNKDKNFKAEVERSVFQEENSKRYVGLVFKLLSNEVITESKCASLLNRSVSEIHSQLELV